MGWATKGIKSAEKAANKNSGLSGKQILGIGVATGVTSNVVGTSINSEVAKHQYHRAVTYKRKLRNGKVVKVRKTPMHGVSKNQVPKQALAQPTVGGANPGIY